MSDYDNLLKPIKRILQMLGLNVVDVNWKIRFRGLATLILISFLSLGYLSYIIQNFGDIENIANFIEACGIFGSSLVLLTKVLVMVLKRMDILNFFDEMRQQYLKDRNDHKMMISKYTKTFSVITKAIYSLVYVVAGFYILSSLYKTLRLPLFMTIPFLPSTGWPFFHVNYVVQLITSWAACNASGAIELFTFFYLYYTCCRIEILTQMVVRWNENIKTKSTFNSTMDNTVTMKQIVEYHSSIKRSMDHIKTIFSPMIMSVLLSNSCVLCMCLISILVNPVIKIFAHITLALTQTFMYCFIGNILIKQNDNLVEKILLVDFYNLNISEKKAFATIVQNVCKPITLKSYHVIVDMTLFVKVVKFSYSIFSFMRTMV